MEFKYKTIIGNDDKPYLRISMEYKERVWSEDVRLYFGSWAIGKPFAEIRICRKILKEIT